MIYNYLKIIIRNSLTDKMYNFIIVFGLAIGIAACLMIAQYIHYELSFDKQYKDAVRIYYTYMRWDSDQVDFDVNCHPAIAPLVERSIPEIENVARVTPIGFDKGRELVIRLGEGKKQTFNRENDLFFADASILDVFSVPLLVGDRNTALQDPHTVLLSRRLADKFFPDVDPMDQTLRVQIYNELKSFKVVGIFENPLPNSSLQCNALFSLKTWGMLNLESEWEHPIYTTFIKLRSGSDAEDVEFKINNAAEVPLRKLEEKFKLKESIHLYPFQDFHFYQSYNNIGMREIKFTGDKRIIHYFSILALLIMVISWANYINLTTARALKRAKEVGLRKVNGASRNQIIWQFLLEFLFLNVISMLVAFTIAQLLFGTFARVVGSEATWIFWREPLFWIIVVLFLVISTLVSGIYPAFIISNYNPSRVLKGNFSKSQSGIVIRKGLVITQFVFSSILITSIYVVSRQLFFLQDKDQVMGTEQVLVIRTTDLDTTINKTDAYQQWKVKTGSERYVLGTSATSAFPGDKSEGAQFYNLSSDAEKNQYDFLTHQISEDYFKTIDVQILYGRDFSGEMPGEDGKIIINERAAHDLGFENVASAIGNKINLTREQKEYEVIGVAKDYMESMKLPLLGRVFIYKTFQPAVGNYYNYFLVKMSTHDMEHSVAQLESQWKTLFGNSPFDYFFLDTYFDTFYKTEQQFAGVFGFFSVVGVVVACMGLFGLSLYNTVSRAKEIGIRKSLGGSVGSIMWLFSWDYLKLVIIASIIGLPVGLWALSHWLEFYPNRIAFQLDVGLVPLLITLLIASFTVGFHTYKTAHMDPVESLRNE